MATRNHHGSWDGDRSEKFSFDFRPTPIDQLDYHLKYPGDDTIGSGPPDDLADPDRNDSI